MKDAPHELVRQFHLAITGMPMAATPTLLDADAHDEACTVIEEELNELRDAATIADQADALTDLIYFATGRLLRMGVDPDAALRLVHEANMRKVPGRTKRGTEHDAAKPEGWRPPNWDGFLDNMARGRYIGLDRGQSPSSEGMAFLPDPHAPKPEKKLPKILLLGYGRHGKDTVAEMLRDKYGYTFTSSSMTCAEHVMLPAFREAWAAWDARNAPGEMVSQDSPMPPIYENAQECFEDRHNHRKFWYDEIERYNSPDKSKLGQLIFSSNDIYVGLRSKREFHAVKGAGLFDVCLWVDASDRVPPEGKDSCTVEPWMADYVIDNNGTLEELELNVDRLISRGII